MNVATYVMAVEDHVCGRIVRGMLLSPRCRELARSWHEAGIPLECVREAIDEVMQRRQDNIPGRVGVERVGSLGYFRSPVEKAWRDRQHLQVGAAPRPSPAPAPADEDMAEAVQESITSQEWSRWCRGNPGIGDRVWEALTPRLQRWTKPAGLKDGRLVVAYRDGASREELADDLAMFEGMAEVTVLR